MMTQNSPGRLQHDAIMKKRDDEAHQTLLRARQGALLRRLVPHIGAQLYRTLLESQAAELAARMNAMESASRNATELMEDLTLKMNKTRQAMITTELNEIVSGSEARTTSYPNLRGGFPRRVGTERYAKSERVYAARSALRGKTTVFGESTMNIGKSCR